MRNLTRARVLILAATALALSACVAPRTSEDAINEEAPARYHEQAKKSARVTDRSEDYAYLRQAVDYRWAASIMPRQRVVELRRACLLMRDAQRKYFVSSAVHAYLIPDTPESRSAAEQDFDTRAEFEDDYLKCIVS